MRGARLSAALLVVAVLGALSSAALSDAQTRTPPKPRPRGARVTKGADAGAPASLAHAPSSKKEEADGGVLLQKTLDGGTKVFRFGELEIEGRLKNPQLVFFLRRVRAEFAAGDLGHRSFLRELSETRHDPNF
jgi:hypothetical protein